MKGKMKLRVRIVLGVVLSFLAQLVQAQYTQQLRGTVVELVLQKPLVGATVSIPATGKSVITDEKGVFRFRDLAVGTYQLHISYSGFKGGVLENIVINAGKETVLTIPLEALVHVETEVILKSNSKKNKPLNDMSAVSARAFTVEETQKYAAAVNDPLRMAVSFPGVMAADDGNNHIVIRGNSPTGLLWRMEGLDIPNPNHFSNAGTSGGGISILSSQLLSNSDFVTGAFAAEYGNALSGVFDLKLRRGNNERREITLQAGLLGLNAAMEGPISTFYKGSYLINYRYSTLQLMNKLGIQVGEGSTNFQDLSYNIYLPAGKAGDFTLFGFGGLSSERIKAERDSSQWEEKGDRYPSNFISNTGMNGITHSISLGDNTTLRSAAGYSITKTGFEEQYIEDDYSMSDLYRDRYKTKKWTLTSAVHHRFNNRHNIRAGVIANLINFNYYRFSKEDPGEPAQEAINTTGSTETLQGYAQWQYKISNDFTINTGLHYLHLTLNRKSSIEPRASVKWDITPKHSIAFGYGLHSQVQAGGVYFARQPAVGGSVLYPNKDLDFTKSHHFVLSHNFLLARNLRLRTEIYYQHLFDVPVSPADSSTFSTLNIIDDYVVDALVNKGKGRNYGIEISLEKYLANNFYFTLNNSIYQSKYTAVDGVERNTRFNGNYIVNLTTGKEFVNQKKAKTFGVNIKTIYAGGYRNTPVDIEKSLQAGYTVFNEKEAYSLQNPAYFRTDIRLSMKWNRRHLTSTLSLDIQNVTNRMNIFTRYYDLGSQQIVNSYQTGFIPVLNYKIEF
jgi:hypothetical protein